MAYTAKSYDHLLGTPGFSDALLKNHFTLYQGYVTNTNKVNDELAALAAEGKAATPAFAEMKRRLGHSPDRADAVMLAWAKPPVRGAVAAVVQPVSVVMPAIVLPYS